jgi:hypothetical protein
MLRAVPGCVLDKVRDPVTIGPAAPLQKRKFIPCDRGLGCRVVMLVYEPESQLKGKEG